MLQIFRRVRAAASASFLLLALLPGLATGVAAAPPLPAFSLLGEQRPFQAEVITEVLIDRTGFLWIGTREGLYLHDGRRFRRFQHEAGNPDSLSSNGIRGIFEDGAGRLWVHTISGGLNLLDRSRWTFRHFKQGGEGGLSHDGVFALAEAPGGGLWVGTQAGLDRLDPGSGRARQVPLGEGGEFVMTLLAEPGGPLWVGTLGQGLHRETADGRFARVVLADSGGPSPDDVFALARDADGVLWVGTREGLYRHDPVADGLRRVDTGGIQDGPAPPMLTGILPDEDGVLWLGTFGHGLYRFQTRQPSIERVDLGIDGYGASHVDQGALAIDGQGGLIVGTFGVGLLRRPAPVLDIGSVRVGDEAGPGLRGEDVYALLADGTDLLAGSFGGGVQRLDPATGEVSWMPMPEGGSRRLDGVVDMLRDRDGHLWVGTSNGLYRQAPEGRHEVFEVPPGSPGAANPGYVYALLQDRAGHVWVGTGGAGLYRHRPATGDFEVFRPVPGDRASLGDDFVSVLMEDRHGRLWVGTRSGGLNLCRYQGGGALACEQLTPDGPLGAPSHHHVADLLEAPDGAVWVATGGGGLDRIEVDADGRLVEARNWTRGDGLVDDNVMALALDARGALWASTRVGLSRLDPGGRFDNYTTADGLPSSVFNAKAAVLAGGRLYLGSTRGIVSIDPGAWQRKGEAPPIVLASVEGLPEGEAMAAPPWALEGLEVPWRQPFSLEAAVLSFDGGEAEFEYRLGPDEPWSHLGERSQLTLHALPPGRYEVSFRGRHANTPWMQTAPLAIDVVPPWWRRSDLQALLLFAVFGLVVATAWWRVRALQARNAELQALQAQKDLALDEARDSRDHLERAFARLRRLTTQLDAAKEEERKHIARELHDEFGQALTAAKINLRMAQSEPDPERRRSRIEDTLAVVEGLITQVRALSLDLRPPLLDELGLVPALDAYLGATASRVGVDIRMEAPSSLPPLSAAQGIMLFRIVQEAVTNALRHADAGHIRVILGAWEGGIRAQISDDGRGFDVEATGAGGGQGFGLFGMRERVHDLGGRFDIESAPGRGTRIRAALPLAELRPLEGEKG